MRIIALTILLTILTLTTSAEEIVTGNLLPNAGDGVDWNSSSTDQINPGSSGTVSNGDTVNGFAVTCPTGQSNCGYKWGVGGDFEVTGTTTLSVDDIALTNNSITQEMLDNGITLNSYIDVANCDHEAGNCEGDTGNTDSHTVIIELKDSSGVVLSTTTQTRTNIDGFQGNCNGYPTSSSGGQTADCGQYNDQVIYNNYGSNNVDWSWTGTDNNTGSGIRGGPNLLGAKLTMTYDNTVIDNEVVEEIGEVFDDLEDVFEYIEFEQVQEMFEEMSFEPVLMLIEEMSMEEEIVMETQTMMEEEIIEEEPKLIFLGSAEEEEIVEETTEIITSFLPPPTAKKEEMIEEEEMVEEESMIEEEMIEEEPTKMAEAPKEEVKEEEEFIEEETEEMVEESNEEEIKEEKSTSETPKKSNVSTKKFTKQKNIQSKETIKNNLVKIMDKIDKDIKDISKNLQIKNIIKLDAMASDQASLDVYNVPFYKSENIYLDQLQMQDLRQVYADITLNSYIGNDPVKIREDKLQQITIERNQLLLELEVLKNG
tara:strand:- start:340 stop:1956 length:1617 start_codon:yes stop_codon:yes gene_type:complete